MFLGKFELFLTAYTIVLVLAILQVKFSATDEVWYIVQVGTVVKHL